MADNVEHEVLGSLTNLTVDSHTSNPSHEGEENTLKSTPTKSSSTDSRQSTEIQKIAHRVNPPTVPSTRTTPLINQLKRADPFQFGTRYLEDSDDVFAWNAWDHVDPSKDELFVSYASSQYALQREHAASDFDRRRFNSQPEKWWNKFYSNNEANFFKDRRWLRQEFPVLSAATAPPAQQAEEGKELTAPQDQGPWNVVLEVGAGAGNTAFPLVKDNQNPALMIHACDFSSRAVKLMTESEHFSPKHLTVSQWDMADFKLPPGVTPGSVDIVLMIFAFSALNPKQWTQAVKNVWDLLRPGGEVCFRDYGRGDLAQVRFRKNRLLGENFYVRGDGTRVYFFEETELRGIWDGRADEMAQKAEKAPSIATLERDEQGEQDRKESQSLVSDEDAAQPERSSSAPAFEILSLATDRRLLVNRQKQLKMYRCWQQARLRKPVSSQEPFVKDLRPQAESESV